MKETLAYDDISLIPKFSDIESRSDCDTSSYLTEKFQLKIPIISSPMDTVTEFEMAESLNNIGAIGAIHRFLSLEEHHNQIRKLAHQIDDPSIFPIIATIGVNKDFLERASLLYMEEANVFLIDVANGHHSLVSNSIKQLRKEFSDIEIIAGNVCTYDGTKFLCDCGVSAVRIGIGGGCFVAGTKVLTKNGFKEIQDIKIGEFVLTHNQRYQKVITAFARIEQEHLIIINNHIECTPNHEFLVVHKSHINKDLDIILNQCAEWISAEELSEDYFLIELTE